LGVPVLASRPLLAKLENLNGNKAMGFAIFLLLLSQGMNNDAVFVSGSTVMTNGFPGIALSSITIDQYSFVRNGGFAVTNVATSKLPIENLFSNANRVAISIASFSVNCHSFPSFPIL
jgi:hypothetical protein